MGGLQLICCARLPSFSSATLPIPNSLLISPKVHPYAYSVVRDRAQLPTNEDHQTMRGTITFTDRLLKFGLSSEPARILLNSQP